MNAKIKLVLAVVLALCFLGLSIGALDVVPKHIEDRFYVVGVEGKWSNLVSLLFYIMAAMCGFYGWLVFRHIKEDMDRILGYLAMVYICQLKMFRKIW